MVIVIESLPILNNGELPSNTTSITTLNCPVVIHRYASDDPRSTDSVRSLIAATTTNTTTGPVPSSIAQLFVAPSAIQALSTQRSNLLTFEQQLRQVENVSPSFSLPYMRSIPSLTNFLSNQVVQTEDEFAKRALFILYLLFNNQKNAALSQTVMFQVMVDRLWFVWRAAHNTYQCAPYETVEAETTTTSNNNGSDDAATKSFWDQVLNVSKLDATAVARDVPSLTLEWIQTVLKENTALFISSPSTSTPPTPSPAVGNNNNAVSVPLPPPPPPPPSQPSPPPPPPITQDPTTTTNTPSTSDSVTNTNTNTNTNGSLQFTLPSIEPNKNNGNGNGGGAVNNLLSIAPNSEGSVQGGTPFTILAPDALGSSEVTIGNVLGNGGPGQGKPTLF